MRTSNSSNCDLNDVCSLFDYAVLKKFFWALKHPLKTTLEINYRSRIRSARNTVAVVKSQSGPPFFPHSMHLQENYQEITHIRL